MKSRIVSSKTGLRALVLAALMALPAALACHQKDDAAGRMPVVRHPIAMAADGLSAHLHSLSAADSALVENFRTTATPATASWDVRQACAALGRGLCGADPEIVARFVVETRDHLHAEFLAAFDAESLERVAQSFRVSNGVPELTVLRIEYIVREAQGAYSGTLAQAAAEVPFTDAVAPRPMPAEWLAPGEDATAEVFSGAAAVLASPHCVEGGARTDEALELYRRALDQWPDDPVLVAGLASLLIENEVHRPTRVLDFLDEASRRDPDNAGWLYLKAARFFRTGQDARALEALDLAGLRPHLSFYGVERARRITNFLLALGYSPIRARVVAARLTSNSAELDLKLAGSKALLRTYEYDDLEACRVLLELPVVIDRQLGDRPHLLLTEQVRLSLLASGLSRLTDLQGSGAAGVESSVRAQGLLALIEQGEKLCGGLEGWGRLLSAVGEERFLRFLDAVLSGGEARFLEACAGKDRFEDCLTLLP